MSASEPATTVTWDPVAVARGLAPRIRELAPVIERERRLPEELVRAFTDAGLFHLVIPRSLGGSETDPVTAARVVEEIARGDGSAGWCVMLAAQNAAFAGLIPAEHARAVYGNGNNVAGVARPIGRAVAVASPEDGFRVSGRWPFASSSSHATWFAAECVIYDGETPRKTPSGDDVTRMLFVPRAEVTLHDTWFTTGLRGTASNDFSIDGAFVPAARGFQMLVSPPLHPWGLYRAEPLIFINHGSHALGVARAAVETAAEIIGTRAGWGGAPLREQPRMQAVIAEATALVESARAFFYAATTELWQAVTAAPDARGSVQQRARVRLAASHAARASVQAVDLVHGASGTAGIMAASPLDRQFRDIHTAVAHVMIGQLSLEAAGRVELGLAPQFPFF